LFQGHILEAGAQLMARTDAAPAPEVDWTQCELIEQVPGKVSGRPVVRGTRILPDAIVGSYELGETIEELQEGFPSLSVEQIKRLIEFAHARQGSPYREGSDRREY
jgi:uncharacterized protein (DUF433 family)